MATKKHPFTVLGVTVHVDPSVEPDPDYYTMRDMARGDDMAVIRFQDDTLREILGSEYESTLEALKGENGKLSAERVGEFFSGLATQIAALKNS